MSKLEAILDYQQELIGLLFTMRKEHLYYTKPNPFFSYEENDQLSYYYNGGAEAIDRIISELIEEELIA